MRKATFQGSWSDDCKKYQGYTAGRTWNGWAMPAFTRDVVAQIVEAESTHTWVGDVLVPTDEGIASGAATIKAFTCDTEDGTLALYAFDGWCWDEEE